MKQLVGLGLAVIAGIALGLALANMGTRTATTSVATAEQFEEAFARGDDCDRLFSLASALRDTAGSEVRLDKLRKVGCSGTASVRQPEAPPWEHLPPSEYRLWYREGFASCSRDAAAILSTANGNAGEASRIWIESRYPAGIEYTGARDGCSDALLGRNARY